MRQARRTVLLEYQPGALLRITTKEPYRYLRIGILAALGFVLLVACWQQPRYTPENLITFTVVYVFTIVSLWFLAGPRTYTFDTTTKALIITQGFIDRRVNLTHLQHLEHGSRLYPNSIALLNETGKVITTIPLNTLQLEACVAAIRENWGEQVDRQNPLSPYPRPGLYSPLMPPPGYTEPQDSPYANPPSVED